MNAPTPAERLPRPTELAQALLAERLRPGDRAIDATLGNGHDAVFLARAVGATGRVFGFDIQPEALEVTRERLEADGLSDRVSLIHGCHSTMLEPIALESAEGIRGVMFNLGYLPGGDKTRITRPETTMAALDAAIRLLAPGGLLTIIAYPGHPGGDEETATVENWASTLDQDSFSVAQYRFLNQVHHPPRLLAIERR